MMRIVRTILIALSVLFFLAGLVFSLQGANILPGSRMTGDPFWLVVGLIMMLAFGAAFYFLNRWRPGAAKE